MYRFILIVLTWMGSLQAGEWPLFRGNTQRTGSVEGNVGFPGAVPAWRIQLGGEIISSPVVSGGTVFIGCRDSMVYAISADSGTVRWRFRTGGLRVDGSACVSGNTVYIGGQDNAIHALDVRTGVQTARFPAGLQISSAVVTDNGWLLSGTGPPSNTFTAYRTDNPDSSWSVFFPQFCYSSPAIAGQRALIAAGDGRLYCVNLALRAVSWSIPTQGGTIISTPAIFDSTVYFAPGDDDRNVYAVRLSNGAPVWTGSGTAVSAATPIDVSAYARMRTKGPAQRLAWLGSMGFSASAGASSGRLAKGASTLATAFLRGDGGIKTSSVSVNQTSVFVIQRELGFISDENLTPAAQYTILALNRSTGREMWRSTEVTGANIFSYSSSPVVAGNKLFAGWGDGRLRVYDATKGTVLWSGVLDGDVVSSPALAGGKLFAATLRGSLYAFDLSETPSGLDFQQSTYCYPNPAHGPFSHVQIYAQRGGTVTVTVSTMADNPVVRFTRHLAPQEKYRYDWNLSRVANGVYFARILIKYDDGGQEKKTVKIAVLK